MNNTVTQYKLDTASERAKFIQDTDSGIYLGTNEEGEEVIILLDRGKGMTVQVRHAEKPKWYECIHYDVNGWQEGVSYEPYID